MHAVPVRYCLFSSSSSSSSSTAIRFSSQFSVRTALHHTTLRCVLVPLLLGCHSDPTPHVASGSKRRVPHMSLRVYHGRVTEAVRANEVVVIAEVSELGQANLPDPTVASLHSLLNVRL